MQLSPRFVAIGLGSILVVAIASRLAPGPPSVHGQSESASPLPDEAKEPTMTPASDPAHFALATFGGGCFWCTEAVFEQLRGVHRVTSGYAGGELPNPTYEQVCSGTTGHAEVVQIAYDPAKIRFEKLLEVFFQSHDPTTLNRQGADVGTQYRSVIFYHDPEQKQIAEAVRDQLNAAGAFDRPIVTEISPYTKMFPAEDYHQEYYRLNGRQPYCASVVRPKVEKVRKVFAEDLK